MSEQNDILTKLPVELALHVFSHLDLWAVWRLQTVSKRWRDRLSSTEFLRSAILRWRSHGASEAAPSAPSIHERSLDSSVRHIRAFQEGRPFTWQALRPEGRIESVQLCGQHLAYMLHDDGTRDARAVTVRDLCTGVVETYRDEARETIDEVILTTTLIAFKPLNSRIVYWKRLDDRTKALQKLQLPSAQTLALGGDGDFIVAIRNDARNRVFQPNNDLLVFDSMKRQLRSFSLLWEVPTEVTPSEGQGRCILVHAERRVVDIFQVYVLPGQGQAIVHLMHVRSDFQGSLLATNVSRLEMEGPTHAVDLSQPQSLGDGRRYVLQIQPFTLLLLIFNAERGIFEGEAQLNDPLVLYPIAQAVWKGSLFAGLTAMSDTGMCELDGRSGAVFAGIADPEDEHRWGMCAPSRRTRPLESLIC